MNDRPTSLELRLLSLLHAAREGQDEFARTELNTLLRENESARETLSLLLVDEQALISRLRDASIIALIDAPSAESVLTPAPPRGRGRSWCRPEMAAAAGLVFGLFTASVVFAYFTPALKRPLTILETSFENVAVPGAAGVPQIFGVWSGDFAEIVAAQRGVTPHSGAKMWRFLRADNSLELDPPASYVGEAIHLVDLTPLRSADAKAGGQIEISAWFAAGQTPPDHRYHWNIKAAAFEGRAADAPKLWQKWNEASTSLAQREVVAGNQAGRWQRLSVTMALPPNADFLVFECAVVQRWPAVTSGVAEFPGHYVDDVRVRILPPTGGTLAQE